MLEREKSFYIAHQAEFREKYPDKHLVIVGESLFGIFDTLKEAAKSVVDRFEPGEFMIHSPANDGKIFEIGPVIKVRYPDNAKKSNSFPVIKHA